VGAGGPVAIVCAEGFAVGVADEGGAIDNLGGTIGGRLEVLGLREEREEAAEGTLIVGVVQAEKVGSAVGRGIGRAQSRGEGGAGGVDADRDGSRCDSGANTGLPTLGGANEIVDGGGVREVEADARGNGGGGEDGELGSVVPVGDQLRGREGENWRVGGGLGACDPEEGKREDGEDEGDWDAMRSGPSRKRKRPCGG